MIGGGGGRRGPVTVARQANGMASASAHTVLHRTRLNPKGLVNAAALPGGDHCKRRARAEAGVDGPRDA